MAEELRNLNALENQAKHEIADHFLENNCQNLQKLGDLFLECEKDQRQLKEFEYLLCFFQIYKGLILLNDQRLIDTLLSSRFYMQTFGALEWDPDALITEGCDPELAQLTKTPERAAEEEQSTAEKETDGEVQAE